MYRQRLLQTALTSSSGKTTMLNLEIDIRRVLALTLLVAGCRPPALVSSGARGGLEPAPPAARVLQGHLSPQEARELDVIRWIHEGRGIIQRFRDSGALADSVEWIVPGPPEILPFAGTWRGLAGITEFQHRLDMTMRYDRVELLEYLVSANNVAAVFIGEGVSRATGRPFHSEILRLYTFDRSGGKILRVRNYYDTEAYVKAVRGQ
jgi:ketosteroid isomerase-like protein